MSLLATALCAGFLGYLLALNMIAHGWVELKPREVSDLVDPKNPGKIVMQIGGAYYVLPGGYEYVPKHLLAPRS